MIFIICVLGIGGGIFILRFIKRKQRQDQKRRIGKEMNELKARLAKLPKEQQEEINMEKIAFLMKTLNGEKSKDE